ncbi:MAG: DUF1415 domain-containing protein [Woeseiaceae bacterium]
MPMQSESDADIITQTKAWLSNVIIAHNYCPFAKQVIKSDRVRYQIIHETEFNSLLESVMKECLWLEENAGTETTLIIFPSNLHDFNAFLDRLHLAEQLLTAQGYDGTYQIASFHPEYVFQGSELDDAANYTNRSPFPMFHLLREASLEKAIENYPDADAIPERNIEFARKQGLDKMKALLQECIDADKK